MFILCYLFSHLLMEVEGVRGRERGDEFDRATAINECDCSESDVLSRGVETLVFSESRESPWQQLKA